jgi:hypothetical protein
MWRSGGIAPPPLTSAIDRGERSASRHDRFTLGKRAPGAHFIAGCVGSRAGLGRCGEEESLLPLPGTEPQQSSP